MNIDPFAFARTQPLATQSKLRAAASEVGFTDATLNKALPKSNSLQSSIIDEQQKVIEELNIKLDRMGTLHSSIPTNSRWQHFRSYEEYIPTTPYEAAVFLQDARLHIRGFADIGALAIFTDAHGRVNDELMGVK